jgi:phage terminase large subunit
MPTAQTLVIDTARVFKPLLFPSRYKAVFGGRASGKSHDRATAAVEWCVMNQGARILCAREVQKALRESAKQLIEDKIELFKVPGFRVLDDEIRTPGGGRIVFQGMNKQNSESIKSYEGFDVAWVEEAHKLSATSLQLLRPTIRKPGSELWFTWNPTRKADAVDAFFRSGNAPPGSIVVEANWSDNPFFPDEMEAERRHDLKHSPAYSHVWEGKYATVVEGSYYASALATAELEGRITDLTYDPLLERKAYWDIGIDDAMTIWITQRHKQRFHFMDYIEGSGQGLDYYVHELRTRGHADAECVLPHDGANRSQVTGKRFSEHLKDAGFRVRVVKNQGEGAAKLRIEAMRRLFPRIWFNDGPTAAGREALGAYHEKLDEQRGIGLGPNHTWASNGADAAGLACIDYEEPRATVKPPSERMVYSASEDAGTGWMQ